MSREGRALKNARKAAGLGKREFHRRLAAASPAVGAPAQPAPATHPEYHQSHAHRRYLSRRNADPREGEERFALLSILVPTIPSRREICGRLLDELNRQAAGKPVEIIWIGDNRFTTTGQKRNTMLQIANGLYVTHFDDDDWPTPDYVDSILAAIEANPGVDVICFDWQAVAKGGRSKTRRCGIGMDHKPHHLMAWRRSLARRCLFSHASVADDVDWSHRINQVARTEARIDRVLYLYRVDETASWGDIPPSLVD
jgi:hypothetical protein